MPKRKTSRSWARLKPRLTGRGAELKFAYNRSKTKDNAETQSAQRNAEKSGGTAGTIYRAPTGNVGVKFGRTDQGAGLKTGAYRKSARIETNGGKTAGLKSRRPALQEAGREMDWGVLGFGNEREDIGD